MKKIECPLCLGKKYVYLATDYITCKTCKGKGCEFCDNKGYKTPPSKCINCKGKGTVNEK